MEWITIFKPRAQGRSQKIQLGGGQKIQLLDIARQRSSELDQRKMYGASQLMCCSLLKMSNVKDYLIIL
jgi:hypothetical protein